MKKTREERQAFLDRIEKKYKEKLLLQTYKRESQQLHRQLMAMRGMSIDELEEPDADWLELPGYRRPTYS